MTAFADNEVGGRIAELLDRVARGEQVVITRGGAPVARLVPLELVDRERRGEAVERLKALSRGQTLGGLKIKELLNEGRP